MSRIIRYLALALCSTALSACGSERGARSADDAESGEHGPGSSESELETSAEIGALDEARVDQTFRASLSGLQRCLHKGAEQVEFLGGGVSFYIEVDKSGSLSHARLEDSTLGDRDTEKCMLRVLGSKTWPKPVGGDKGYARKSFDFDMPNDVRPPTEWDGSEIAGELEKLAPDIESCKQGAEGRFKATMYVSTEGNPLAVGIAPPDEAGDSAIDCLVTTLKGATYPSPGSWPAKVSFQL